MAPFIVAPLRMLSGTPWKAEAIVRLFLGLVVCVYGGSLIILAMHFHSLPGKPGFRFYAILIATFGLLGAALVFLRKKWTLDNFLRRMAGSLVCLYAAFCFGLWLQKFSGPPAPSVAQMIISALSFQGAALILVAYFLHEHQTGWVEAFGFSTRWPRALLLGFILACLFLPVGWGLQLGTAVFLEWVAKRLPQLGLQPQEQQAVQTLQMAMTFASRLALGVVTIILAPMAEEILFRGILYRWIRQAGFPRLALWGTALLFAAVHLNLISFIPLALLAVGLALLYERTGNLLAPITAHALFNALNFAILYSFQQTWSKTP